MRARGVTRPRDAAEAVIRSAIVAVIRTARGTARHEGATRFADPSWPAQRSVIRAGCRIRQARAPAGRGGATFFAVPSGPARRSFMGGGGGTGRLRGGRSPGVGECGVRTGAKFFLPNPPFVVGVCR